MVKATIVDPLNLYAQDVCVARSVHLFRSRIIEGDPWTYHVVGLCDGSCRLHHREAVDLAAEIKRLQERMKEEQRLARLEGIRPYTSVVCRAEVWKAIKRNRLGVLYCSDCNRGSGFSIYCTGTQHVHVLYEREGFYEYTTSPCNGACRLMKEIELPKGAIRKLEELRVGTMGEG